jgi:hypothetical protein
LPRLPSTRLRLGSEISGAYEAKAVDDTRLSEVLSFDIHKSGGGGFPSLER